MRDVIKETTHGKLSNSTTTRVTQTKANLHTNWAFYFELQAMGSNGTPKLFGFSESRHYGMHAYFDGEFIKTKFANYDAYVPGRFDGEFIETKFAEYDAYVPGRQPHDVMQACKISIYNKY